MFKKGSLAFLILMLSIRAFAQTGSGAEARVSAIIISPVGISSHINSIPVSIPGTRSRVEKTSKSFSELKNKWIIPQLVSLPSFVVIAQESEYAISLNYDPETLENGNIQSIHCNVIIHFN